MSNLNNKNQNQSPSHHQSVDYIDLKEVFHTILRGKWLIFLFILLASLIAFIIAYGQFPVYKAEALLRVESQKAIVPGLEDLASLTGGDDTSVGTELELIKSKKNLYSAIEALKLDINARPKKVPYFGYLYQRFYSPNDTLKPPLLWDKVDTWIQKFSWGNEQIKVNRLTVPKSYLNKPLTVRIKEGDLFELVSDDNKILEGRIGKPSATKDKKFRIFISELTGLPNTEFVIKKLSQGIAIANLQDRVIAGEQGKKTGIIALSLTGYNKKTIVKLLDKVSSNYVEQNKSRSSEEARNALRFLEEQIKPVRETLGETEAHLKEFRTSNKTADLSKETQSVLDVISSINEDLQKFSLVKEELSQRYTDEHPKIQAIVAQEKILLQQRNQTQSKISQLPKTQQRILKLESNYSVANAIYIDLLNKIQEFKIAKASTVGNAYIVDIAAIDERFIKPKKSRILSIGALLGLILGLIIVFLRKALRTSVNNPEKLEEELGLPVYATIPLSTTVKLTGSLNAKNRRQKSLLALDNKNDPAIESLRSLRTSLHFALHEAKNNVVMITGPAPGIGKSFISSNFAAVIAASEKRVILIDADMRKGYQHDLFKVKLKPGLSDIVSGNASLEDVIQTVKVGDDTMDIITRGQTPPNPSELLMHNYYAN
jgi:tyrosine-protein kinase Etk/Wzc